ncbi:MAG TPA: TonB-dependent receptor [Candidatus Baltobacteraceae bacterium]|jgi:hypothetical protein|nr:TonB-dependent receptor [Candidatus Baltobacteraceae bacterium]
MTIGSALRFGIPRMVLCAILALGIEMCSPSPNQAAESTTGILMGHVLDSGGKQLSGVEVSVASPSGHYLTKTDRNGRFTFAGIAPDTYVFSAEAQGYQTLVLSKVVIRPGEEITTDIRLQRMLTDIAKVTANVAQEGIAFGQTRNTYQVVGSAAQGSESASSSGLATYARGSVQAAVAEVPGVQQDQFSNVIFRGGKVEDTVFSYDAVPVPQALIAEPGGNVIGAQLATTGVGLTNVTSGGFSNESSVGLAGTVDQIPAAGIFPAESTLTLDEGILSAARQAEFNRRWATPDLRNRYAFSASIGDQQIAYGDGHTFYPSEAGTYGLGLSSRATWSAAGNAHFRLSDHDDLAFVGLAGEATYSQYGTPFSGETYGEFDGTNMTYPNEPSPDAAVTTPSVVRGTYGVHKVQLVHTSPRAELQAQLYHSQYEAATDAPFFDDLSFPNGPISYYSRQGGDLYGAGFDVQNVASERHQIAYGADLRSQTSSLNQLVPTFDESITSQPLVRSSLLYLSDRWSPSSNLVITPTIRASQTSYTLSDGNRYGDGSLDPHLGAVYKRGSNAVRLTYDHTTVAPLPLEAERNDSSAPQPFTPLSPEAGNSYEASLEHIGASRIRLTYFAKVEHNLIDVLPANFRSAIASGESPTGVGVPTNAGDLLSHGAELTFSHGLFSLTATAVNARSSSASQFGYNDLNAAAIAAGHLFPVGYVPDFHAILSYNLHLNRRISLTPNLSFESGYPYGNGKMVWIFDPTTNHPEQVPNDNHVNPGYNYYFLENPAQPYNPQTNPIIGSLGTPEGNDPNTLRTAPQILASLHLEAILSQQTSLLVDVVNLFGTSSPTQMQGNPYLIGPPGYRGGNAAYGAYYGSILGEGPYTLGNGVPTMNGQTPALPWNYGTGGYVPSSYPEARSILVRLRIHI